LADSHNLIHLVDKETLSPLSQPLSGHGDVITQLKWIDLNQQSSALISASLDGSIALWDLRMGSAAQIYNSKFTWSEHDAIEGKLITIM
jgi:WD40 repeat protein